MQEHPPVPSGAKTTTEPHPPDPLADPRAMQILSTEHWSLLATRSLSWSESFARAGLFLSAVSATAVALALVGQASDFGPQFVAFALVMLPVALFLGLATFTRLDEVNVEDALWVAGMNRIRHAYLEIGPGLRPYFITGSTDDPPGFEQTVGVHRPGSIVAHWLVTMPGMIAVIDAVLAGLIVGLGINALASMAMEPSIVVGAITGIALFALLASRSRSSVRWFLGAYRSNFPSGGRTFYNIEGLGDTRRGEDDGGEPRA